ncbi:protein inscuteable homolog [Leptopilina heterotoma]|uniref:protein inscuteable homolog n=1 Tax=Leptopilina heterotoma TaxID=63436 RepID=UPI001CA9E38E|nr:protein inscuteable homolog [Leptopilina heterotoma]
MSGFKRRQSRVFWNQMATQDLNGKCSFSYSDNTLNNSQIIDVTQSPRTLSIRIDSENSSNFNDYDDENDTTTDVSNVTVIRVEPISQSNESSQASEGNNSAISERLLGNVVSGEERSYSPASLGHKSLDSGFSDSDSSCAEVGISAARRRRVKNRQSRQKRPRNHRLNSLWRDNEAPPYPSHHSTPKRLLPRFSAQILESPLNTTWEQSHHEREEDEETSKYPSMDSSSLGDYLFATEPPEDSIPSTSSSGSRSFIETSDTRRNATRLHFQQFAPVNAWLLNLAQEVDEECGVALQSKALPRRKIEDLSTEELQTRDLKMLTASATTAATKLLLRAEKFEQNYQTVFDKISHLSSARSETELLQAIEEDAFSVLSDLGAPPPRRIHQGSLRSIIAQLENLKDVVDTALNTRLDFYVERVVRGLEEAPSEGGSAARGALAALTALGMSGPRAGSSIARCSGVRTLLTSLISAVRLSSDLRSASLRALASVCCCSEAIEKFVNEDGPEILVDLLATELRPETEKMEAAALVVQITAPWTNAMGLSHLEPFAVTLVDALTKLAEKTACSQTLLLAAAALNHLSKSRTYVGEILKRDSIKKLLQCVKKAPGGNVWLMEQVASLIGEVARIPEARKHLAEARASVALVCFLRMRPPGLEDAYQRLEITAAAALTRLCVDPEIARQVVAVGGTDCLPSYNVEDFPSDDEDQEVCLLKYTKSLRMACRKAAQEIDVAKSCDYAIG